MEDDALDGDLFDTGTAGPDSATTDSPTVDSSPITESDSAFCGTEENACNGSDDDCDWRTFGCTDECTAWYAGSGPEACRHDLFCSTDGICVSHCLSSADCADGSACGNISNSANLGYCAACHPTLGCLFTLRECGTDADCLGEDVCKPTVDGLSGSISGRCGAAGGGAGNGAACGEGCIWGAESCVGGICAQPCGAQTDCPSGYGCSLEGNSESNGTWPAQAPVDGGRVHQVPVCLGYDDPGAAHNRVAGESCASNGDCRSDFCDASSGVCIELCSQADICDGSNPGTDATHCDSSCPGSTYCILTYISATGGSTFARACVPNVPITLPLTRM